MEGLASPSKGLSTEKSIAEPLVIWKSLSEPLTPMVLVLSAGNLSTDVKKAFDVLSSQVQSLGQSEGLQPFFSGLQGLISKLDRLNPIHLQELLHQFSEDGEGGLYNEVGSLLRRFHTRLVEIGDLIPEGITGLDTEEVSGMAAHLEHILEITDKAANRTLDLAEESIDSLVEDASALSNSLQEVEDLLQEKCLTIKAKKRIILIETGLKGALEHNGELQNRQNEILLAQDYQDLTGQLIQKVLGLVSSLEKDLLSLVKQFGDGKQKQKQEDAQLMNGPMAAENEQRQDQDDVNSLLSQFGF